MGKDSQNESSNSRLRLSHMKIGSIRSKDNLNFEKKIFGP